MSGDEGIGSEHAERGRAIEQDGIIGGGHTGQGFCQGTIPANLANEFSFSARKVEVGWDELHLGHCRREGHGDEALFFSPLRKGHSRCMTAWRCSSSQCRNRSCTEAGNCKIKRAKLRVSKISK